MDKKELSTFITSKAVALIRLLHNTSIGAREFSGGWCPERVDAILFNSRASFLIETKTSRADFLADAKKPHRQEGCGVGNFRYYACPPGLIRADELPPKWGLIYADPEAIHRRAVMPVGFGGYVRNPRKDTKHPTGGWTVPGVDIFGTTITNEHGHEVRARDEFYFENPDFERDFLFALACRYRSREFMGNIL